MTPISLHVTPSNSPAVWRMALMGGVLAHLVLGSVHGAGDQGRAGGAPPAGSLEDLLQAGQQLWDEYAPAEVKAQVAFPTMEAAEEFMTALQSAFTEGSFAEIAAYEVDVRRALGVLRGLEGGDELADWLQPRLDLVAAAGLLGPQSAAPAPAAQDAPSPLAQPYWDRVVVSREPPASGAALVPRLKKIFAAEGIPPEWVWIAEVESSMNPKARSPVGARGLFQFMPATAERFGMSSSFPDERTNPDKSARAAAQYLRFLHGELGSWPLALAAYNAGEGRVGRALKSSGAKSFPAVARHLPAETRLYVPKVMATVAHREGIKDPAALPAPRPIAR